ncbi:hypothetical protein PssiTeo3_26100 [Pseudomonas sichuanensis]|nr:hypothetical protein [Pseudomonas sichuanensis]
MEIIRFEGEFTSFTPQPLKIEFRNHSRKLERYTPDGLIHFKDDVEGRKPLLFEIKYREDFRKNWRTLMPKFRAAKKYCASVGWDFEILTEKEIRTPYLSNIKFLWPFKSSPIDQVAAMAMKEVLEKLPNATISSLLHSVAADQRKRALFIAPLWGLIATGSIQCDLSVRLNMMTKIWLGAEHV